MLFAAPLKSKGFPGRTFSSKNSRGSGTTSELSIDPDGGWWDPKGCKCPGGCWDSRGDKKQTESKPISSRMFLQNTRKSTWTWTSLKWNNFGIRHNLRMFIACETADRAKSTNNRSISAWRHAVNRDAVV